MPSDARRGWTVAGICLLLAGMVFAVFGRAIGYGFINFDDGLYVYQNPIVLKGLSLSGIGWAFTHVLVGHWHPLTFIGFMLDCQLFGARPGGHHFVNLLLHAGCAVLLFLMLLEMTGALWRSWFVTAVFAIHPLRVESVVWVSELKDVLSGVFFMLTLWAYARYVKSKGSYWMIAVWFALGLMSKPMLVTIPCVLLLLDYWPLRRLQNLSQFPGLLKEKIPLFVLCALSSAATVFALRTGSGNAPISSYPANAPIAYVTYLRMLVYPSHLALLYPLPKYGPPMWQVFDAVLILTALTAGAWLLRRSQPFLLTGWLWYLGMLVPVIGIIQTGEQAYADRYTYLPQIGLCFAGTWMAADWAGERRNRRVMMGGIAAAILCALLIAAWHQTSYWQDTVTLWTHSIECTPDNYLAYDNLGDALLKRGRLEDAIAERREAVRINPSDAGLHNNLGYALYRHGETEEAVAEYREAMRLDPNHAGARTNLGDALLRQGRTEEAVAEYREAIRIDSSQPEAHNNLGCALFQEGRMDEGIAECREALRLNPDYGDAYVNIGNALLQQGRIKDAIVQYRAALQIDPTDADTQNRLASAMAETQRPQNR